jgi:phosphate transport system substrate-binding protein
MNTMVPLCASLLVSLGIAVASAQVPERAPYVLPHGSIYLVGDRTLEPLLDRLNSAFVRDHPGLRFTSLLRSPPVGLDGIIARVSFVAPLAHDAWEGEIDSFKRLNGYRPLDIHIGRLGYAGRGGANPPAIYVNAANPLRQLTLDEVARVFTAGKLPADLRHWSQLGATGEWSKHRIHLYGTRDDGLAVTTLRLDRFGGHPFAQHYEALPDASDVLEAVAGDRYGIGLAGPMDAAAIPAGVRLVALARDGTTEASAAGYDDVQAGRYPLSPFIHLYVDAKPGQPLDPLVKAYLRLALSPAGQQPIAAQKGEAQGLVPLNAAEAAQESAKLD